MTDNFIGERFSQLREARNVSARKMSLDLGHSTSYTVSYTHLTLPTNSLV